MSTILFPALPINPLTGAPRLATLCTNCGHLELREIGAPSVSPCPCPPTVHAGDEFAVLAVMTAEPAQVWEQLTPHVPDHVIGRVLRIMNGEEDR